MFPVADRPAAAETQVDFDAQIQSLDALNAAAYRLIGSATCRIEKLENRFVCRLVQNPGQAKSKLIDADGVRRHFLDLVTDENLRERLAIKTEPVRNLILSLAFGSLASRPTDSS